MTEILEQPYSKSEIAALYGVSIATLKNWIKRNKTLKNELKNLNVTKNQKTFTILQSKAIFKAFGMPTKRELNEKNQ